MGIVALKQEKSMSILFSNKKINVETREMRFGTLEGIVLGEEGRCRKELFLPSKYRIKKGINENLGIGKTKTGRPRIAEDYSEDIYLIIDTKYAYTRVYNGNIYVSDKEAFELVDSATGADGEAGSIGHWSVYLLKVKDTSKDLIVQVHYAGNPDRSVILIKKEDKSITEFENINIFKEWLDNGNKIDIEIPNEDWDEEDPLKNVCRKGWRLDVYDDYKNKWYSIF